MSNIVVGQKLPEFEIVKGGVATESGAFEAWGSDELLGKATYFIANAGHPAANEMHQHVSDKVRAAGNVQVCHIINAKDAPMGASMFIKKAFKTAGKEDTANTYVMDAKGVVAKELDMEKASAVVAVADAEGTILFSHEGLLGADEEAKIMEAITSVS